MPPSAEVLDQVPLAVHFVSRLSERADIRTALATAVAENAVAAGTAAAMPADFNRVLAFAGQGEWLLAHVVLVDGAVPATTQFGVLRTGTRRHLRRTVPCLPPRPIRGAGCSCAIF